MAVSQGIQEELLKEATSATPNYSIDYSDQRFTDVNDAKADALTDLEQTYGGMIGQANGFYQQQIDAVNKWGDEQIALQNQQTEFAKEQIEQQREQAQKDYLKEQSGAYVDWQKQSNKYGANAEQMASAGLTGTGFAETSQVGMYNTYQMRVASARESMSRAMLNYDNAIKDAMLQNNAAIAEIAYQTLQQSLQLALEGFQYENQLLLDKANKKIEIDNIYYNRYQDVLQQINHENAVKEDIRQYNETMAWQKEKAEDDRKHSEKMALIEHNYQVKRDEATRTFQEEQARLDREHDLAVIAAETQAAKDKADKEWEIKQKQLAQEQANAIALLEKQKQLEQQALGGVKGRTTTVSAAKGVSSPRTSGKTNMTTNFGNVAGKTTKTTTSKSSNPPINMKSVMALGQGAMSSSKLASLVASGQVLQIQKNGEIHVVWNPSYHKKKYSFGNK